MRIKNFTLMLMAVLFSAVGFAQKSIPAEKRVAFRREAMVQRSVKQNALLPALAVSPQNNSGRRAVAKSPAKASELVTPPEDGEVEYFTLTGTNSKGGSVERTVQVIWDGDDDVYISGLSYYMPYAFVKGTFQDDENVLFEKGQYMGSIDGQDVYFGGVYKDDFVDVVARFDDEENAFVFDGKMTVIDNGNVKKLDELASWKGLKISPSEDVGEKVVEVPSNMESEMYAYTAMDLFEYWDGNDPDVSGNVNVGFYGNDVYIQGMSTDFPEAWIKGTFVNDTTVVFPSGQLLSESTEIYFVAVNENFDIVDSYSLIYEASTGIFYEGPEIPMINTYKDQIKSSVWQLYCNYEIKPITEKAATPAKSAISSIAYETSGDVLEFSLAKVDVDGDGLVAEKLYYKLFYSDESGEAVNVPFTKADYPSLSEDLTEMPATYTDSYISEGALTLRASDHQSWARIGIQCVYYGGDERNEGEIAWHTPTWPITVTLPEDATVTEHTLKAVQYKKEGNVDVEKTVGLAFVGSDMYIRGIGDANDDAWIKGTKNADGNYVFAHGQDLGRYGSKYRLFFLGFDADGNVCDVTVSVNAADGVYEFAEEYRENASYTDRSYYLNRFLSGATITIAEAEEEVLEVVEVPEGLETEAWSFTGYDYFDEVDVSRSVNVGFDGEDVYVQGVSEVLPEAWVQGIVEDGQITFPASQYLGQYRGYDIFFLGWNSSTGAVFDYVMEYDAENGVMTNASDVENIGINIYKNRISGSLFESYNTVTIKKVTEKVATPSTPAVSTMGFTPYGDFVEFSVPTTDVDGDGLVSDLLSYKFFYDEGDGEAKEITFTSDLYETLEESLTEIPYSYTDDAFIALGKVYLNMDHESWARIGIQSIYTGGGESNASEIGWYTITHPTTTELPEDAEVSQYVFSGSYYSASGSVEYTKNVNVAFVDNDVYVQGIGRIDATAWIKGTKSEDADVYTFAKGQYMGRYESSEENDDSYLFLMGYSTTFGAMDVKMSFDAETGAFTTTSEMVENADYVDKLYYVTRFYAGATITPVPDVAAVPEMPSIVDWAYTPYGDVIDFNIPTTDIDGNSLSTDKLSYKLYYMDTDGIQGEVVLTTDEYEKIEEDMTEIPYGYTEDWDIYEDGIYLNMDHSNWVSIGIQSIYAGGGEKTPSDISWYTIIQPQVVSLPDGAEVEDYGFIGTNYATRTQNTIGGVKVAKVDDNVYVQGICTTNSDAWIMGTKNEDGVYSFPLGQFLGVTQNSRGSYVYAFLLGYDAQGGTEFKMTYDEETGIFTSTTFLVESANYVDAVYSNTFLNMFLTSAQLIPSSTPDAISSINADAEGSIVRYNIAGQRVGKQYKGIVVENGKKVLRK